MHTCEQGDIQFVTKLKSMISPWCNCPSKKTLNLKERMAATAIL